MINKNQVHQKDAERAEIQAQTDEWLSRGNTPTKIPAEASSEFHLQPDYTESRYRAAKERRAANDE